MDGKTVAAGGVAGFDGNVALAAGGAAGVCVAAGVLAGTAAGVLRAPAVGTAASGMLNRRPLNGFSFSDAGAGSIGAIDFAGSALMVSFEVELGAEAPCEGVITGVALS